MVIDKLHERKHEITFARTLHFVKLEQFELGNIIVGTPKNNTLQPLDGALLNFDHKLLILIAGNCDQKVLHIPKYSAPDFYLILTHTLTLKNTQSSKNLEEVIPIIQIQVTLNFDKLIEKNIN